MTLSVEKFLGKDMRRNGKDMRQDLL